MVLVTNYSPTKGDIMNNSTISKVLQGLVLVHLSFSVWSGKKKLRPEDLKGANLPPDKLASLGSKRIFDPDALKVFATLKRQAERSCEEVGVRFLGGYAIPEEKLTPLMEKMELIEQSFATAKTNFLSAYDDNLKDWLAEAGEWSEIVARAVEPANRVAERLSCGFTAFKVESPGETASAVQQPLERQVDSLADQLIHEIGALAKSTWEESYRGRTSVTRKALRPLKAILDKLSSLSFVGPDKISGLVSNVHAALDTVSRSGPVTGATLMGLVGVLCELSDIAGFITTEEREEMLQPLPEPEVEPVLSAPLPPKTVTIMPQPVQQIEAPAVWFW
jgi:hypothetical protein